MKGLLLFASCLKVVDIFKHVIFSHGPLCGEKHSPAVDVIQAADPLSLTVCILNIQVFISVSPPPQCLVEKLLFCESSGR